MNLTRLMAEPARPRESARVETMRPELTRTDSPKLDYEVAFAEIRTHFRRWGFFASALQITHFTLVGLAVICSIYVAASAGGGNTGQLQTPALVAAVCVGLVGALSPDTRARRYREAWRLVNNARLRFRTDQRFGMSELMDAYARAESVISSSDGVAF